MHAVAPPVYILYKFFNYCTVTGQNLFLMLCSIPIASHLRSEGIRKAKIQKKSPCKDEHRVDLEISRDILELVSQKEIFLKIHQVL